MHPLAYVEWLTPFGAVDIASGLHTVTRSTRMHQPYAEIIEVDRILRSCHLVPMFGRVIEPSWTAENVVELCRSFYVNHYIDYHMYIMVVAQLKGCIAI